MAGLGIAFGEFIPITTVINHWFIRRRSMAMGLFLASGGLGGFVFPPLISKLISDLGWRWAWGYLAGQHLFLTVILGGILIRNRPEDMGQYPDGISETQGHPQLNQTAPRHPVYQTAVDWTAGEAMRTPALWMIMALFSIILFVTNMLTTHQVAYLQDLNFSPLMSATALGLMLGMSIIGRLACGFLGMRFEGRHLAVFFLTGMGLGIMALILARGVLFIHLYSVLTGIGFGGMIVLMPNLLGAYFGRTHYSRIVGWTAPVVTLISAGSPTLAGFLYDVTGKLFFAFFHHPRFCFSRYCPGYPASSARISGGRAIVVDSKIYQTEIRSLTFILIPLCCVDWVPALSPIVSIIIPRPKKGKGKGLREFGFFS